MYLWRAIDAEGEVLEVLIQRKCDTRAGARLLRKFLKKQGLAPTEIVTDRLRSYGAAFRALGVSAQHIQGKRKNNRAENSTTLSTSADIWSAPRPTDASAARPS
jgi:putative transposase